MVLLSIYWNIVKKFVEGKSPAPGEWWPWGDCHGWRGPKELSGLLVIFCVFSWELAARASVLWEDSPS